MSEVTTIPNNLLAMKRRNKRPLVISVRTKMEGKTEFTGFEMDLRFELEALFP
jgi:hypothetical protein